MWNWVPDAIIIRDGRLVGAFSVIVQPVVEPMEHYTALLQTLNIWAGKQFSAVHYLQAIYEAIQLLRHSALMMACGLAREIGSIGIVFATHRSRGKASEGGEQMRAEMLQLD